jgi:Asp-tRNA(Asn)/Glu-tRNA(Gln) amidotransferase A subunit family amidase
VSRYRPFGLQISAPHYHDRRLLDIAALFEAAFPWTRSAPGGETVATVLDVGDVA